MPSVWEIAGEALGGPILAPLVIGGVVVAAIASPEARQQVRRWGVRGMAAVMAAGDVARRELGAGTNGTSGLAAQIGHRLKEAATEVREDWEDFVAEARAERERRQAQAGESTESNSSNGGIVGMDEGSSGAAALHGRTAGVRRARSAARRPRR